MAAIIQRQILVTLAAFVHDNEVLYWRPITRKGLLP